MHSATLIDAAIAHVMGLVNRVVPLGELDKTVRTLAATIAENAPLTVQAAKAAIRATGQNNPDADAISAMVARCFGSEDYAEGRRAFAEKRRPGFKGQ